MEKTSFKKETYRYDENHRLTHKYIYVDNVILSASTILYADNYSEQIDVIPEFSDTLSRVCQYYNDLGLLIKEYRKENEIIDKEISVVMKYDTLSRLTTTLSTDLKSKISEEMKYQYAQNKDTAYTYIYMNGLLIHIKKGYKENGVEIEASKDLVIQSIDTMRINGKSTFSISYFDELKTISIHEYDDYGNPIKTEYQYWEIVE